MRDDGRRRISLDPLPGLVDVRAAKAVRCERLQRRVADIMSPVSDENAISQDNGRNIVGVIYRGWQERSRIA